MTTWTRLKNAEGKSGVRFREHPTRKHGILKDRYFVLAYWWQGKTVSEAVGWASQGWTPTKCFDLLATIRHHQRLGGGPCTLAELREQETAKKETERKRAATEQAQTLRSFFYNIYWPDAKQGWKPSTSEKAELHVRLWIDPVTKQIPMRELGLEHVKMIKARLAEAGRSPRTQQYVFRTFSMIWNAALEHGYVTTQCPTKAESFRLPKIDNEKKRYLSIDEEQKFFAILKDRDPQVYQMALVALDAGLRFGEVASLTWQNVDEAAGLLNILNTKSGDDRQVPMTSRLKAMFGAMQEGTRGSLVFPDRNGVRHREAPGPFRTAVRLSGLNDGVTDPKLRFSFHGLRHTCASRLVQADVSLLKVQRILGHSTPAITARYAKLETKDLAKAIEAMESDIKIRASNGKVISFIDRKSSIK